MTNRISKFTIIIFLFLIGYVETYKFLVISPVYSFSHVKFMRSIANTLSRHGHDVVVFQQQILPTLRDKKVTKEKNVKVIDYEANEDGKKFYENRPKSTATKYWTQNQASSPWSARQFAETMSSDLYNMCIQVFADTDLHKKLKEENFDVVISEPFDPCGLYLADFLKINTTIVAMASSRIDPIQWAIGQPSGLNFIPGPNSKYGPESTILDRFNNVWQYYTRTTMFRDVYSILLDEVRKTTMVEIKSIDEIIADSAYLFFNSNPYLDFPFPSITKCVPIGGFSMNVSSWKSEKLPRDLDQILNEKPQTVYISFGSVIRSADMPEDYKTSLIRVFKAFSNVTFIWKYEDDDQILEKLLPANVHLKKWLPQPSLLVDDRVKLFITHGGLGSIMEVAYAAKPAIVIPLFFDQPMNAETLARHGGAIHFSKFDLKSSQKLIDTIGRILGSEHFSENAIRLSNILISQPIDPVERLVKHAEFAAKFKKLPELDPYSRKLNFFQFYFLDIILIFSIVLYLLSKMVVLLVSNWVGKLRSKQKSE